MTISRALRALSALALASTVTACGGGATEPSAASSAAVSIADSAYSPADLDVAPGAAVTWSNDDDALHTVTFDDAAVDSSDQLDGGDTFTTTFAEEGTYSYFCAVHPEMTATVSVR